MDVLASAPSRRYGELKPPELDGNTFGYHLKMLLSEKYISKADDGSYELTAKGRSFIVHRYENQVYSAHSIYLIVIKNDASYLLRTRKVQPLLGYKGFIHGEPEHNRTVTESAKERLMTKTGLDVHLEVKGSALITQFKDNDLQSYSHAVILYGETHQQHITENDETGKNGWSNLTDQKNLLPSCRDIIAMIDNGDTWLEKAYHL